MKYRVETTIDLPRDRVIELFDNPDNLVKWMPGLEKFETVSGEPGKPGARSELVFDMKGRKVEMIETILSRNLPDEFSGTYEARNVWNSVSNRFYEVAPNKTRWVAENEFKFEGPMKVLSIFMKGGFTKQSQKSMVHFKEFAERRSDHE